MARPPAAKAESPSSPPSTSWGVAAKVQPRWPARVAILVAIVLTLELPHRLHLGPYLLVPALEFALLVALTLASPLGMSEEAKITRVAAILLIAVIQVTNIASLVLLIRLLLYHSKSVTGLELIYSAIGLWLTNVIVFALWYWELDRGGPEARRQRRHPQPDFLFPQMMTPECTVPGWTPGFLDYLYVAFTNATAFSPTDTLPLTPWAKSLMLVQSIVSLATITLVAARAVNILG